MSRFDWWFPTTTAGRVVPRTAGSGLDLPAEEARHRERSCGSDERAFCRREERVMDERDGREADEREAAHGARARKRRGKPSGGRPAVLRSKRACRIIDSGGGRAPRDPRRRRRRPHGGDPRRGVRRARRRRLGRRARRAKILVSGGGRAHVLPMEEARERFVSAAPARVVAASCCVSARRPARVLRGAPRRTPAEAGAASCSRPRTARRTCATRWWPGPSPPARR